MASNLVHDGEEQTDLAGQIFTPKGVGARLDSNPANSPVWVAETRAPTSGTTDARPNGSMWTVVGASTKGTMLYIRVAGAWVTALT